MVTSQKGFLEVMTFERDLLEKEVERKGHVWEKELLDQLHRLGITELEESACTVLNHV